MKITDVSSAPKPPEVVQNEPSEPESKSKHSKKTTLLQRYNIPVEHLDFAYVDKCTDAREIERILRILRSGEEGTFPDLEQCVVTRLKKLNPKSHLLRVETPAIRIAELGKEEREAIQSGLEEWLNEVTTKSSKISKSSEIFKSELDDQTEEDDLLKKFPLPIRGSAAHTVVELNSKQFTTANTKKDNESRIKSWEYDKWDKYDVDTELTKLDITDMKREEWERREKPKVIEEQKKIEKLMKSMDDEEDDNKVPEKKERASSSAATVKTSADKVPKLECLRSHHHGKKGTVRIPVEKPSYIEEVNDDDGEEGVKVDTTTFYARQGPRKARVVIEDLNLAM